MIRCASAATLVAALTLATLATVVPIASAQPQPGHRVFPATALRGELVVTAAPEVTLNGKPERLAPGARIRGDDNLLAMSAALTGRRLTVHYTREANSGMLLDVWILKDLERANRPWPVNEREAQAWSFDPAGQTWKKP